MKIIRRQYPAIERLSGAENQPGIRVDLNTASVPSNGQSLSIAIVAYRSDDTIEECLDSIAEWCSDSKVVVVDNSGCDRTKRSVAGYQCTTLDVRYLRPGINLGYAKGIAYAVSTLPTTELLLILNPDTRLLADPRDLTSLLKSASIVAGTLISPNNEDPRRVPNARQKVTYWRELQKSILGSRRYHGPLRLGTEDVVTVDQIDGAYMLVEMPWFILNQFDNRFELYYEDVEFCRRAWATAKGCAVSTHKVALHLGGSSAAKSGGTAYLVNRVSRARYYALHFRGYPRFVLLIPFVLEFISRSLARKPEGMSTRWRALVLAARENGPSGTSSLLGPP
jgi:N-acetylglucosaminyl-diphospho-decaprenol L-rhamnosyltransferase